MKLLSALAIFAIIASAASRAGDQEFVVSQDFAVAEKKNQASAALHYLQLISDGELNLDDHTAISKHCSPKRRSQLEAQIKRSGESHFKTNDTLSIEAQLTDAAFASVLVRAENTINPFDIRIHPVALLRKNKLWIPAPLLGSFSNTGYGYDQKTEQSVRALETWMAKQKILHESQHRQKALADIKSKLTNIEQEAGFDKMTAEQATSYFLEQCRSKNTLGILACIGRASEKEARKLSNSIDLVAKALKLEATHKSNWHYFTNPSCVTQVIEADEKSGKVLAGCFNPEESNSSYADASYKIFTFQTESRDGKTFIQLPSTLNHLDPPVESKLGDRHGTLRKKFATVILQKMTASKHETTGQLLNDFLSAIKQQDFSQFMRLTTLNNDYFGNTKNHHSILTHIAKYWCSIPKHDTTSYLVSEVIIKGQLAVAMLECRQAGASTDHQVKEIWMLKDQDGWHITPTDIIPKILTSSSKNEDVKKIDYQLTDLLQQIQQQSLETTFTQTALITLPLTLDAVPEEAAKTCLLNYREQLRNGDMKASLSQCAMLEDTDKSALIKDIKRLIRGAKEQTQDTHILGTSTNAGWVGVSARTKSKISELYDYPLYLITNTAKGPRVFINLDLRYPRNSGRKYLNEKSWKKLDLAAPQKSLTSLNVIFKEHIKRCEEDIAAAQK